MEHLSGGPVPPPIPKTSSRSDSIITSTHSQSFSFYYYFTNDTNFQPFYNFQASGANVPGFGANVGSRYQQFNPSHTWTISNSLVNEFRFTYMREGQLTFQHPQVTGAVQDSCSLGSSSGGLFQRNVRLFCHKRSAPKRRLALTPTKAGITTGLASQPYRGSHSSTSREASPSATAGRVNCPRSETRSCGRTV